MAINPMTLRELYGDLTSDQYKQTSAGYYAYIDEAGRQKLRTDYAESLEEISGNTSYFRNWARQNPAEFDKFMLSRIAQR